MILQKFFPKILAKINSPINGEISVVEQFGRRKIVVGGLTQSGPMAEEVWKKALKEIKKLRNLEIKGNILILGLGGGSLVKLINQYFPRAKIVGVEIDPIMIELGKKYLDLAKAKNLEIEIVDASDYLLYAIRNNLLFDLIFVDLYLGEKVPENCQNEIFLQNLKKTLSRKGLIIFNRLYYKNHIFEAKIFLDKIKKIFNDLGCKKVLTNLLVFAKNNPQRR